MPRWIRHQAKRPITVNGFSASSTNERTWSTYANAKASKHGDGLGFVLNGDGIVCVDLDHCITDGVMNPVAQAIVDALPGAYVEVSPSGSGVHIWGRAILPKGYRFDYQGQAVEIYPSGRYLTMTANVFRAGSLAPLNLNNLIAKSDTLTA